MRTLLDDLRYTFRMFRKNAAITAVAVLSLAIAIGPNATLFGIVDRLFLQPSPVKNLDEVFQVFAKSGDHWVQLPYTEFEDVRSQARTVSALATYEKRGAILTGAAGREMVPMNLVSDNYFSLLQVKAAFGRTLEPGDGNVSSEPPVVISSALWRRRFGGDPGVVGKPLLVNGRGFHIAGVMGREFRGLGFILPVDLWIPIAAMNHPSSTENIVARGRPGFTEEQVQNELTALVRRLPVASAPGNKDCRVYLQREGNRVRDAVFSAVPLGLAGLILLIACANIANVLLAQSEARRGEIAVRLAMGAGRWRLVRQLLTEALVLSALGAGAGLLLARWLTSLIPALMPVLPMTFDYDVSVDVRMLGYTLLISLLTALAFGLAPALQATKPDLIPALKGEQDTHRRKRLFPLRSAVVVGQVAVSQLLLIGAALLARSYFEMQQIRPGFDVSKQMLLVDFVAVPDPAAQERKLDLDTLRQRLGALPGVRRASYSSTMPLSGSGEIRLKVSVPGRQTGAGEEPVPVRYNAVGRDYFRTMGTRILRGSDLDALSPAERSRAVLVNDTLARRFWPGEEPVGKRLQAEGADYRVVGVFEDGKYTMIFERPQPFLILAAPEQAADDATLLIETAGDPAMAVAAVRKELAAAAPQSWILGVRTLRQFMRFALFLPQTGAGFVGAISLLGIFLASVGLYGIISYAVQRRAHEIGVRLAIGARPADIVSLVLRRGLGLAGIGVIFGLAAAAALARVFSALLYNVSPWDPAAIAASVAFVIAVALAASLAPARRATRLDPIAVLRRE